MTKIVKKYVAYDPETFKFIGFYEEDRKGLPSTVDEINPDNFMEQKGGHSHYNPETRTFYTPAEDILAREIGANKGWRDWILNLSDKYMLEDFPVTGPQGPKRVELKMFRQALRDYDMASDRPAIPDFIDTGG